MSEKGRILLIFGTSGSGKTTLMNYLKNKPGFYVPVYTTTRPKRKNEKNYEDYIFVEKRFFNKKDYMLTYECHNNQYGIPKGINEHYKNGEIIVLGLSRKFINKIKQDFKNVNIVFINVKVEEIRNRLLNRDNSLPKEELDLRYNKSLELISWAIENKNIDYYIDNFTSKENFYVEIEKLVGWCTK